MGANNLYAFCYLSGIEVEPPKVTTLLVVTVCLKESLLQ